MALFSVSGDKSPRSNCSSVGTSLSLMSLICWESSSLGTFCRSLNTAFLVLIPKNVGAKNLNNVFRIRPIIEQKSYRFRFNSRTSG